MCAGDLLTVSRRLHLGLHRRSLGTVSQQAARRLQSQSAVHSSSSSRSNSTILQNTSPSDPDPALPSIPATPGAAGAQSSVPQVQATKAADNHTSHSSNNIEGQGPATQASLLRRTLSSNDDTLPSAADLSETGTATGTREYSAPKRYLTPGNQVVGGLFLHNTRLQQLISCAPRFSQKLSQACTYASTTGNVIRGVQPMVTDCGLHCWQWCRLSHYIHPPSAQFTNLSLLRFLHKSALDLMILMLLMQTKWCSFECMHAMYATTISNCTTTTVLFCTSRWGGPLWCGSILQSSQHTVQI